MAETPDNQLMLGHMTNALKVARQLANAEPASVSSRLRLVPSTEAVVAFLAELTTVLSRLPCSGAHEKQVQNIIENALKAKGWDYAREVIIGDAGRIDFEIPSMRVGIEIKVTGGLSEVTEQMSRYADTGRFAALLLVTTRQRHRMPATLCGVPIRTCHLWGAVL